MHSLARPRLKPWALAGLLALASLSLLTLSMPSRASASQLNILGTAKPTTVDSQDAQAVELGVKFTTQTAGTIVGIRFYKSSTNTGNHVGSIWSASGKLLGRVTFSGETPSGWQRATFASPIQVTAGTTYVASYFAPHGHYSSTPGGLKSAINTPPLQAVANGTSPDGLYLYTSAPAFPSKTYNANNYFADVVFTPAKPLNSAQPAVSGQATQGKTLTATTGSWSGTVTGYSYAWKDCNSTGAACTRIAGATKSTYTLAAGDVGHELRVTVAASNWGTEGFATSKQTGLVAGTAPPSPPANTAKPVVSGSAAQGSTLSASTGSWSGTPTSYKYQWQDCNSSGASCTAISGADGSSYVLVAGDVGHTVRVAVTAANSAGSATATSNQTAAVTASSGATTDCFASPGKCGYPDPSAGNVGVPAGTTLTASKSLTVTTAGATIQNLDVTGTITVAASNVTIKDVRITTSGGSGAWGLFINKGATGTTIVDSTIRGAGNSDPSSIESAVWNHYDEPSTTGTRDYFYNCADCWEGSGVIDDSYMIVNGEMSGAHYEDIYVCSSSITVDHDTLLNPMDQTATVFGDTICGGGNAFTVTNSLLAGGGFLIYPAANSSSVGSNSMTVTNNRFARCLTSPVYNSSSGGTTCSGGADSYGYYPYGGYFGSSAYIYCPPTANQVWSGNVWDDNNAAVKC